MINYGFCLWDNQFSSCSFPLVIDSYLFQFIRPNLHNNLLDKELVKVKKQVNFQLKFTELNSDILKVFRTYNADIFSSGKIGDFGKITNLGLEIRIIDQLGQLYQEYLNVNGYAIIDEKYLEKLREKELWEQCTEMIRLEKMEVVVQQIKYLQEVVTVLMLLKNNEGKELPIIQSYIPHSSLKSYMEKVRLFLENQAEEKEKAKN